MGVRFVVELEAGKPTVRLVVQVLRVIDALGGTLQLDGLAWCTGAAGRMSSMVG